MIYDDTSFENDNHDNDVTITLRYPKRLKKQLICMGFGARSELRGLSLTNQIARSAKFCMQTSLAGSYLLF